MIAQFKTVDDTTFRVDTGKLRWSIVGELQDAEGNRTELESGSLTPQPRSVYVLDGRKPNDAREKNPRPGAGLTSVAFLPFIDDEVLTMYMSANVPIKEFTIPVQIEAVRAIIAPGNEIPTAKLAAA